MKMGDKTDITCQSESLSEFDVLVVRLTPLGSAEQVIFRMDAFHRLENLGVKTFNTSGAIEKCADKFYACSLLEDEEIPVPRTIVTKTQGGCLGGFQGTGGCSRKASVWVWGNRDDESG